MKTLDVLKTLPDNCPRIQVWTSRDIDPDFTWDGDGPDPTDEGMSPYNVTVSVQYQDERGVRTSEEYLGGCYMHIWEPIGCVGGYLRQTLLECIEQAQKSNPPETVAKDLAKAHGLITASEAY